MTTNIHDGIYSGVEFCHVCNHLQSLGRSLHTVLCLSTRDSHVRQSRISIREEN
jgi:hypothetical protein